MSNTEDTVKKIISDHLGVDNNQTSLDSNLVNDLGADSLDSVEIVMAIEDTFGVEIPEIDEWKLNTVQDIVDYVKEHVSDKS